MLYKRYLFIFLISIMTFIMWMMFTIKVSNTDYKTEPARLRRNLETRASAVVTTHRPSDTRNDTNYQKGITRIVSDLKGEFSSIKSKIHINNFFSVSKARFGVTKVSESLLRPSG